MGTQISAGTQNLANALAQKFGMGDVGDELMLTLKQTAFKGNATDAQFTALMVVANQYSLNPWTREIYAFPDQRNGIVPIVGVDGWSRIINEHDQFDGIDFEMAEDASYCTCIIYRKDRTHPIKVTEYLDECKRDTGPWKSHKRRMLRHKAMIQCARIAFGYTGIYDEDEAERIIEKDITEEASHEIKPVEKETTYYTNDECNAFESKVKGYFKKGHSLLKVLGYLQSNGKQFTDDQKEQIEIWQEEYQKSKEPLEGEVVDEHKDFKDALEASEGDK